MHARTAHDREQLIIHSWCCRKVNWISSSQGFSKDISWWSEVQSSEKSSERRIVQKFMSWIWRVAAGPNLQVFRAWQRQFPCLVKWWGNEFRILLVCSSVSICSKYRFFDFFLLQETFSTPWNLFLLSLNEFIFNSVRAYFVQAIITCWIQNLYQITQNSKTEKILK